MDWIDIKKQVPPDGHKPYLTTRKTINGRLYVETRWFRYSDGSYKTAIWEGKCPGEIVAWMPLPKPFREQEGIR